MRPEWAVLVVVLSVTATVEARTVSVASFDRDTGAVNLALDAGAEGEATRALLAAWNPSNAGEDATAWRETALVAEVDAATTSATYTIPADWRAKSGAVRFFLMEKTAPYAKRFTSLRTTKSSCWIDTGVVPDKDTDISVTACYPGDVAPFGVSGKLYFFSNSWKPNSNTAGYYFLSFLGANNGGKSFEAPRSATSPVTYRLNATGAMIDGDYYIRFNPADQTLSTTSTLTLFGRKNDGATTMGKQGDMTIFSAQIRSAGMLTHDYVPCEKPDGTKTLYNRVTGEFAPVSGSGEFAAGDEIAPATVDCGAVESATDALRFAPEISISGKSLATGEITVTVSEGHDDGLLLLVGDTADAGTTAANWKNRVFLTKVAADETTVSVPVPTAWWNVEYTIRVLWKSADGFAYDRELESVYSDGAAYALTDWIPTRETEVTVTGRAAPDVCLTGLTEHFYFFCNGATTFYGFFGKNGSFASINTRESHTYRLGIDGAFLDGEKKGGPFTDATVTVQTKPLAFPFRRDRTNGTIGKSGFAWVQSAQIRERGDLVRDFVPCVSDDEVGLYDRVKGVFYPSVGTTAFEAGETAVPVLCDEDVLAWSEPGSLKSEADSATWDGGGADSRFTTAANWDGDIAPNFASGNVLLTFATKGSAAQVVGPTQVRGLKFNARNDFTLSSTDADAVLSIGANGITLENDPTETISGNWRMARFTGAVEVTADQTWNLSENSKRRIQLDAGANLIGCAARTLTIEGQGTIGFVATNSFAGNIQINGGVLKLISKKQPFGRADEGGVVTFDQTTGAAWNQFGATIDKPLVVIGADKGADLFYTNSDNGYGTNTFTAPVTVQMDVLKMKLNGPTVFSGGIDLKNNLVFDGKSALVVTGQPLTRSNQQKLTFLDAKEVHFHVAGNSVGLNFADEKTKVGNRLHFWVDNVLDYWGDVSLAKETVFDLHGTAQNMGDLSMANAADQVTSEMPADLFCFYDAVSQQNLKGTFTGAVTFRKSGKCTASLQGASTSTGALVAQNGKLILGAGGSWTGTDIRIGREDSNRKPTLRLTHNDVFADARHTVITMITSKAETFYTDCGERPPVLELDEGVEQVVKDIYIDGRRLASGTWGSSQSAATHKDDVHFAGTGVAYVIGSGMMIIFK